MTIKDDHYVVDFSHIDDYRCLRPLREAVLDPHTGEPADSAASLKEEQRLRSELAVLFRDAGWEGDGEINCIFVPPCLFGGDGWCGIIYHVKQSNDGISWLAIPNAMRLSLPEGMFVRR